MNDSDREVIRKALILVYDNRSTSASRLGLERRAANLDKIEEMLCDLIGMSEDCLDEHYMLYLESEGR